MDWQGLSKPFSHLVSWEVEAFLLQHGIACTDCPCSSLSPHCSQCKSIPLHPYFSPPWTQSDLSRNSGQTKHNQPEEDAILLAACKQHFHRQLDNLLASKELAKIKNGVVVHSFGCFMEN